MMENEKKINDLFRIAREQEPQTSFNETKDLFLQSLGNGSAPKNGTKKINFLTSKKWIIMTTSIITLALAGILFFQQSTKENTTSRNKKTEALSKNKTPMKIGNDEEVKPAHAVEPKLLYLNRNKIPLMLPEEPKTAMEKLLSGDELSINVKNPEKGEKPKEEIPVLADEFVLPKLTPEEIENTVKQKKKMLKALAKLDEKAYRYIPSGTFDYFGKQISVQAYYMGVAEVTNLEYRTFLYDLVIQGRKEDFLKARVDNSQWTKVFNGGMQAMEEQYFTHPAYDDYPVVNVSREGAELYCKWLTTEINKADMKKKFDTYNDVRLPVRAEWAKAASNEGKTLPYACGAKLTNSQGCYLANLTPGPDSAFVDGGMNMVYTKSYNPSDLGLFCMSGNVAEMVYDQMGRKEPGTAGGGWMDSEEALQIFGTDPYKGMVTAHPNIGFRVVMTHFK